MSPDRREAALDPAAPPAIREDLRLVASMIDTGARVLDIGCGDGELLYYLAHERGVDGRGMELSQSGVNAGVRRGLAVIQGDADNDLDAYPAGAFDYVVLSQTLPATRHPRKVMQNLVRIAHHAIVSFPNFGHWAIRLDLMLRGRMPMTKLLSAPWYDTPNIHFCTIRDFLAMCAEDGILVERSVTLDRLGRPFSLDPAGTFANLLSAQAIFQLAGPRR
jgi:methionine biosynthesis protein MetW